MKYFDFSHRIENGMVTYPGLPGPEICDFWSREYARQHFSDGASFQIGKIEMVANTGTYLDVPFHRFEKGEDLANFSLEKLSHLPALIIRHPYGEGIEIGKDAFVGKPVSGKAILLHTGWDRFWQKEQYAQEHPFLSESAAIYLRDQKVALVGIDALNIDDTRSRSRPVHTLLLGSGIPIVEHLRGLDEAPDSGFLFHAVPPKIVGMGSFPVRAFGSK